MNDQPTRNPSVGATVLLREPGGRPGDILAHGFLTGTTTVLVPDPPVVLGDPWRRFLVRISQSPDPGGGAETIPAAGLNLAALVVDGIRASAAVLPLVRPSRHTEAAPDITRDGLTESVLRHRGDLWAAYADLGYPVARPPDALAPPPEAWWLAAATADVAIFIEGVCCPSTSCCVRIVPDEKRPGGTP
ncbi:hypothetical protein J5Y04_24770 [Kitasatospora sp. RG8]|uniref:hypothetical protein n=1 Tax=Kitasatospora sp. RG8 TaxID=2820815 RepID=UPI001AE030F7|nr:hypothetical protein [Kitasatospora sp. RG8]MBP0452732.1 hypothetical protein [Kitasatospora sp. RG8]